jgi:hypothetical protein
VLIDGQDVTMSGVSPRDYAGTFPIRIIDPTTFTYSLAEIPSAPPAGTRIVCNGQFTTETQQTAGLAFGDATSSRGRKNEIIRTRTAPFDIMSRIFDPNPTAEGGYSGASASGTSRWKADGTPWRYTFDGTHPNSHGYTSIAAAVPDDLIQ